MKTKLWALALTLILTVSAWADIPPEVVILPIEMPGYYNPLDSEALTKVLQTDIQKKAPRAGLQVSRASDLTAYQYKAGSEQPPSLAMADKICRAYSVNHLVWVSIRFQPDFQDNALALAGAARFWVYSADARGVMIDQPLSLVRVGQVSDVSNEAASRAVAVKLAEGCVQDLAGQMVTLARRSAQAGQGSTQAAPTWNASQDYEGERGSNYKAMVRAANTYQRAMKNNNLIDITSSQADMQTAWVAMSLAERNAIKKNYPDLATLMTMQAAPAGYYGGGYWPYR